MRIAVPIAIVARRWPAGRLRRLGRRRRPATGTADGRRRRLRVPPSCEMRQTTALAELLTQAARDALALGLLGRPPTAARRVVTDRGLVGHAAHGRGARSPSSSVAAERRAASRAREAGRRRAPARSRARCSGRRRRPGSRAGRCRRCSAPRTRFSRWVRVVDRGQPGAPRVGAHQQPERGRRRPG